MLEYYLALGFFASALCVDIEITGDLAFDVKIRNYSGAGAGERPRGVDVDIPLRFSIGNTDDDRPKAAPPREQEAGGLLRVVDDGNDGSNATSTRRPAGDGESSLEASNRLREEQVVSDVSGDETAVQKTTRSKHKHRKKKKEKSTKGTTLAPAECPYRYPEPWEANAVLSNMMNKLTKLFMMMSRALYPTRPRTRAESAKLRRFKVISARNHHAFDQIFHNMSTQYKLDYNASRERILRSHGSGGGAGAGAGGECASQAAVGRAWRRLLERAQDTYRAAALRVMDVQLGPWLGKDGGVQGHLNSALTSVNKQMLKDVERIRSEQLRVLCRIYKLC